MIIIAILLCLDICWHIWEYRERKRLDECWKDLFNGKLKSDELWRNLCNEYIKMIDGTRKALERAVNSLRWYNDNYDSVVANEAIKEVNEMIDKITSKK